MRGRGDQETAKKLDTKLDFHSRYFERCMYKFVSVRNFNIIMFVLALGAIQYVLFSGNFLCTTQVRSLQFHRYGRYLGYTMLSIWIMNYI